MKTISKGFTIIEVIVALAISTVVGAAMWTLIDSAMSSSSYFLDRQELDDAMRLVQFTLHREEQCREALRDGAGNRIRININPGNGQWQPAEVNVATISNRANDGSATTLIQSTQRFGRLSIGQMVIRETVANSGRAQERIYRPDPNDPTRPVEVTYDTYLASLLIPANARDGKLLETRQLPFKIYVHPGTREIESCFLSADDNQTCGAFGGTFDDVSGRCRMNQCNDITVNVPCQPLTTGLASTCTAPVYFWGFESDGNTMTPVCICHQVCSPPDIPPPPPPPPNPY